MYGVVLILDIIVSGSRRLINLINSGKKGEKEINRNPVLCVIVFIIACILLGTAYYKVTTGMDNIDSFAGIANQIVKGISSDVFNFRSVFTPCKDEKEFLL